MNEVRNGKIIIQFDGICILCSKVVRFILKADRKNKFLFQALPQNEITIQESVVVIDGDNFYRYSAAVLKICKELGGLYQLIFVILIIPPKWRDNLYRWVAKNRYRWFGKKQTCFLPSKKDQERFI